MPKTQTPRPLSIPKMKIHLLSNPDNIEASKVSSIDEIIYEITEELQNIISKVTKNTKVNDLISQLKNLIPKIYKAINDNNRKLFISKKSSSSIQTSESLENDSVFKIINYPNGNIYEGKLKNGKRDGKGIMKYHNGCIYEGNWESDLREGKGVFYAKNSEKKERYEGEFKNGKMEGKGISYFKNGDKYEGQYKNWKKEGNGIYYFYNGDKYEGEFNNDLIEGKGKYFFKNGDIYRRI